MTDKPSLLELSMLLAWLCCALMGGGAFLFGRLNVAVFFLVLSSTAFAFLAGAAHARSEDDTP